MMPARRTAFSARAALLLAIAHASSALAADGPPPPTPPTPGQVQAARELFAAASKDEEASRWTDALEKLHRVADVKLTAGIRYHIAFCEEKLGQIATALAHYTEAQEAAEREHGEEVLDLLRDPFFPNLRARVPTLSVEVPADVEGAVVTIDAHAHPSGLWGVAVPIDPGVHRIEATAPGRERFAKEVTLHEREVTVLDVVLPASQRSPSPSPSPPPLPSPSTPPFPLPSTLPLPSPSPPRSRLPAILSTTGALVLAGGGVAAFLVASSAQTTGQTECLARTTCDDLKTPVRTWDAVALGSWIGAAALGTAAVVLWATPRTRTGTTSTHVAISPGQLLLQGSF